MQCNHWTLWCAFLLTALVGCAGSESPSPATQAPSSATGSATEQPAAGTAPDTSTPERAVAVFLDAVRRGDDQVASSMFTPLAREKTAELDIQVAPRGSDTAKFDVGEVQYLDEAQTGARVKSAWTDLDPEGKPRTDDIVWMLRRAADGWRVAGMAAVVFDGEDPLLLDFEKPEETLKKLEMLRAEMEQRAKMASSNGQPGSNPASAGISPEAATEAATAAVPGAATENSQESVRR